MWAAVLPRRYPNGVDDSREVWNPTPLEILGEVKTEQLLPGSRHAVVPQSQPVVGDDDRLFSLGSPKKGPSMLASHGADALLAGE